VKITTMAAALAALAFALLIVGTAPTALAQDDPATPRAVAATQTDDDDDDGGNWGLWGLAGLAGLAGLLKRPKTEVRTVETGVPTAARTIGTTEPTSSRPVNTQARTVEGNPGAFVERDNDRRT
jgi:MYXO-CTERM domain-containing protein